jgi:hypothetical protein
MKLAGGQVDRWPDKTHPPNYVLTACIVCNEEVFKITPVPYLMAQSGNPYE